jgi:dolichol kinase
MLTKEEINRKLLHLIALLMPVGILYWDEFTGRSKWLPPLILAGLFFFSLLLERLRFLYPPVQRAYRICFGALMRGDEEKKTTGATHIIAGALFCSVVFVDFPEISFMALVAFILGDAAAAVVGLSIGRTRILGKSLEGSLACFGLCLCLFAFLFPKIPHLLNHSEGPVPFALMVVVSLVITLAELIPVKITESYSLNDNLYVPVLAGLVLKMLQPLF